MSGVARSSSRVTDEERMKYVAYYRVSTSRQGRSGLGLEAQKAAVGSFVGERGRVVASFVETESGKSDNRPELAAQSVRQKNVEPCF